MLNFIKILALAVTLFSISQARAEDKINAYASVGIGGWNGNFSQSAGSYSTKLDSGLSMGFNFAFGVDAGIFRVEYAPHWYWPYVGTKTGLTGQPNDMSSWSLLAGNILIDLPLLPITPYVGGGTSHAAFSFGTNASYGGLFWRGGCILNLSGDKKIKVGLRAEFQKHYLTDTNSGSMPTSTTTRFDTIFIGLALSGGGN